MDVFSLGRCFEDTHVEATLNHPFPALVVTALEDRERARARLRPRLRVQGVARVQDDDVRRRDAGERLRARHEGRAAPRELVRPGGVPPVARRAPPPRRDARARLVDVEGQRDRRRRPEGEGDVDARPVQRVAAARVAPRAEAPPRRAPRREVRDAEEPLDLGDAAVHVLQGPRRVKHLPTARHAHRHGARAAADPRRHLEEAVGAVVQAPLERPHVRHLLLVDGVVRPRHLHGAQLEPHLSRRPAGAAARERDP